jgi:hypothetical protein
MFYTRFSEFSDTLLLYSLNFLPGESGIIWPVPEPRKAKASSLGRFVYAFASSFGLA